MKSMITSSHDLHSGGSGMFVPGWDCCCVLNWWNSSHPAKYFRTEECIVGQ
jgi:hypothetical protein